MQWYERLVQERKRLGLSQDQVVAAMSKYLPAGESVGKGALCSWESGRTQPKIHHALALARVLNNADVSYLFSPESLRDGLNDAGLQSSLNSEAYCWIHRDTVWKSILQKHD